MKYDAFISYRHLEKDMYVAKRVHKALETTKIPKKLQKEIGRKKIDRVFRDQEELPIGSDLGANIEAALQEAAFLVVICSPQTQESYWVMKEIDTFIAMHGRENVLAVLVEGEPADSFPPQLLTDDDGNAVEPLAADVRGKNNREIRKKLKTEALRLAASILHVDYDDLKQRHRERQMHRNMAIAAAVAVIAISFGIYNAYNLSKINAEYQQKLINESKVLAATSLDVLESGDTKTAALIAMEGVATEENNRPYVSDAVYALSQALNTYGLGINLSHDLVLANDVAVDEIAMNEDGSRLISYDVDDTIYIWNLDNGECLFKKQAEIIDDAKDDVLAVGYSKDIAVVVTKNYVRGYYENGDLAYEKKSDDSVIFASVDDNAYKIALNKQRVDPETFHRTEYIEIIDARTGEAYKSYENQTDVSYGADVSFNSDASKALVAHQSSDDEITNYVTYIDFTTDNMIDIPVQGGSIMDMIFTDDGNVAVASLSYNDLTSAEDTAMHVIECEPETAKVLWSRDLEYIADILSTSYTHMASREVEVDGLTYSQIMINASKKLYVLDMHTGDDISTINTNAYIQKYFASTNGNMILLATSDGKASYYDALTADIYNDYVLDVDDSIMDFTMSNKVFASRGYRSPNIIVMRFKTDENYMAKRNLETGFYGIAASSPEGDTFVISTTELAADVNIYRVFETASANEIGQIELENPLYSGLRYIDNNTIMIATYGGKMVYYHLDSKKTEYVQIPEATGGVNCSFSSNDKYVAYVRNKNYYVIDNVNQELLYSCENEDLYPHTIALSNDGKRIFVITSSYEAYSLDAATGKTDRIFEDYEVDNIVPSTDDSIIAVHSRDGILHVLNVETDEILNEFEFHGDEASFVEFSADNKLLYLQGDDLYFSIYDLENDKTVFLMDEQINDIVYTCFDEENNRLSIHNYYDMYVIDLNSYGMLDYAEYGRLYIPQAQVIVSVYGTSLTEFAVQSKDDLIERVKERFGDAKLTELQRLKYRID